MISRRTWLSRAALLAAGAALLDRARLALGGGEPGTGPARRALEPRCPPPTTRLGRTRRPKPAPAPGALPYTPVVTPNGSTLPFDEGRREGVPPRRRAGRARVRAGHERQRLGLQRHDTGPDDRGGRGRPRAPPRHEPAARAHHHPLARHPAAGGHGRRRRPATSRRSSRARPTSTSSRCASTARTCTTRTPTRWCRWRWG